MNGSIRNDRARMVMRPGGHTKSFVFLLEELSRPSVGRGNG